MQESKLFWCTRENLNLDTMQLIIASTNLHKIRELRSMLKEFSSLDLFSLRDFPHYIPPEETGKSFEENAKIKALHAASTLHMNVLADDSGLVIPALGGEPGIYSSRYAGKEASDAENRDKLINKLKSLPDEKRFGYFECCLVLATPKGITKSVSGLCEGELLCEPRGSYGFGYDSVFLKHDYRKTFAEVDDETKHRISHRRKAFDKLIPSIHSLF